MKKAPSPIYVLNVESFSLDDIALLSDKEKERFARFRKDEDKALFLGGRKLIRHYVGGGEILLQENNKPYIKGEKEFSLTHSYPYVALVVDNAPIGLDLEALTRLETTPVSRYFPEEDIKECQNVGLLWCLKEACYKADGTGYFNPKERLIKLGDNSFLYRDKKYYFQSFTLNGFLIVAVSNQEKEWSLVLLDPKDF